MFDFVHGFPPLHAAEDVEQKTSRPKRTRSGPLLLLLHILMAEGNPDTQK